MMTPFSQARLGAGSVAVPAYELARRSPQWITATLSWRLHRALQERVDLEGRSVSNLVAHILESGI